MILEIETQEGYNTWNGFAPKDEQNNGISSLWPSEWEKNAAYREVLGQTRAGMESLHVYHYPTDN